MKSWVSLKRAIVGSLFLVAVTVAPALAAGPTLTDAGSAYWTARVDGSGFTPSGIFSTNWAYVEIYNVSYDDYGNQQIADLGDWVQTSSWLCFRFTCWSGGTFHYERYMAPLQCGQRWARALDWSSGYWTNWIQLDCA